MNKAVIFIVVSMLLLGCSSCVAEHIPKGVVAGRLIVVFCEGITLEEGKKLLRTYNLDPYLGEMNLFKYESQMLGKKLLIKVPEGSEEKWIKLLKQNDKIADVIYKPKKVEGVCID